MILCLLNSHVGHVCCVDYCFFEVASKVFLDFIECCPSYLTISSHCNREVIETLFIRQGTCSVKVTHLRIVGDNVFPLCHEEQHVAANITSAHYMLTLFYAF